MKERLNVLVIDDDVDLTSNLQDILEVGGYGTVVAHDSRTALTLCGEQVFDLVITDIRLPGMSGIELIQELSKLLPEVEYIIITGYASLDSAIEAVAQKNIIAYETKPINMDHLLALIRQVSERKQAEIKIRRAAEEWRTTFDSINDLISIRDRDFRIIRVNKAFADTYKSDVEGFIGKKCYQVVHGTKKPLPNCPLHRVMETKQTEVEEYFDPRLNIDLEVTTSPVLNEKGEVVACVHIGRDVTEHRRMEQQARQAATLREIHRLRTNFLANVSHELRTPLASIKGFISTLLRTDTKWSDEEQRDFLETVDHEADRLTHLISDLLDMSRIDTGALKLERNTCHISEILDSIGGGLGSLARHHQLKIIVPSSLPPVFVDKTRVGQVLINLVENASKYSPEQNEITVEARLEGDLIVISVIDRGGGIPPDLQDKVFDRFYQAEGIVTGQKSGTGLGLSICRGIIEAHGGRIWVESKLGGGSKFRFSLPVGKGGEQVA